MGKSSRKKYNRKSIMRFFGKLKHVDWDEREKNMKSFRREVEERFK